VPRPPARRGDAEVAAAGEQATAAGDDAGSTVTTRLHGLESRVAVAEKSTRALLVEVVRLQAATRQVVVEVVRLQAATRQVLVEVVRLHAATRQVVVEVVRLQAALAAATKQVT